MANGLSNKTPCYQEDIFRRPTFKNAFLKTIILSYVSNCLIFPNFESPNFRSQKGLKEYPFCPYSTSNLQIFFLKKSSTVFTIKPYFHTFLRNSSILFEFHGKFDHWKIFGWYQCRYLIQLTSKRRKRIHALSGWFSWNILNMAENNNCISTIRKCDFSFRKRRVSVMPFWPMFFT